MLLTKKILKFGIAGVAGFLSLIIPLYILTDILGLWYLLSSVISFVISIVISFTLQKLWVFGDKSKDVLPMQSSLFLGLAVFNLVANTFLMYTWVDWFNFHYLLSQILSSLIIATWSFLAYHWLFSPRKEKIMIE